MGRGRTGAATSKVSGPLSWPGMPCSLDTEPGSDARGKLLKLKTQPEVLTATTTGENQQITVFSYKIFKTIVTVTSWLKPSLPNQTHQI